MPAGRTGGYPDIMIDDETKQRIAHAFVGGLIDGDLDRMRSVLADSATWSLPGETAVSGTARGADAVIERGSAITSGGVSIELQYVLYGADNVAVMLHNTGTRGDAVLDEHLTTVFRLDGEKIVEIETLISDVPMLNSFFAAEG